VKYIVVRTVGKLEIISLSQALQNYLLTKARSEMDATQKAAYDRITQITKTHSLTRPTEIATIEQVHRAANICSETGSPGLGGRLSNLADWLEVMTLMIDLV
jgi:hypothetical protein